MLQFSQRLRVPRLHGISLLAVLALRDALRVGLAAVDGMEPVLLFVATINGIFTLAS